MCSGTPRVFFDSVIDCYFFHKSLCFMESKYDRRISTGFDIFFIKTL